VTVPAAGVALVLEPADRKLRAGGPQYEGKFSLRYAVASMLVRGHVAVVDFTDERSRTRACWRSRAKSATRPGSTPRIRRRSRRHPRHVDLGETFESDFAHQKAAPENPLSPAEVQVKFRDNAGLVLSDAALASLEEALLTLERQSDLSQRSPR